VTGQGRVQVEKQDVEGNDPHGNHRWICEGDRAHYGVSHEMVEVKLSESQLIIFVWNV